MNEIVKRYPGAFSGERMDEILNKADNSGKPLSITVNGDTIECDGMENKAVSAVSCLMLSKNKSKGALL